MTGTEKLLEMVVQGLSSLPGWRLLDIGTPRSRYLEYNGEMVNVYIEKDSYCCEEVRVNPDVDTKEDENVKNYNRNRNS